MKAGCKRVRAGVSGCEWLVLVGLAVDRLCAVAVDGFCRIWLCTVVVVVGAAAVAAAAVVLVLPVGCCYSLVCVVVVSVVG